jgi:exonuclease SbcC
VIPDAPVAPPLPPVDQAPIQRVRAALAGLNVEEARKSLALAQQAATRLEETGKQRAKAEAELAELTGKLEVARKQLDPLWAMEHGRMLIALEAARREYTEAQRVVATLEAQIESMRQRIEELEASERDLGERKVRTEEQACEAAEWRWLERATGADGIQALELDAMGPEIAEVANRLLSSAYGSRFAVEFRTTRIAGRGSRVKQVEDFSIWILDGEAGTEQELSTLSGGESVWIKRAIYDAFGIIRDKSTGTRFLTVFQDEADGALDPAARLAYFEMLRAAHAESGRRHTVVITHSPEVQEMIGQKIVMGELAKKEAVS